MSVSVTRRIRSASCRLFGATALVAALITLQVNAASAITAEGLNEAARAKVFFGHQSVGANVLAGVPGVYASQGVKAPPIVSGTPGTIDGGFIAEESIGANGNPLSKIADFDRIIRGGMSDEVDVALMKFCYLDVTAGTDVASLFGSYRNALDALQRDFPDVTFLYSTTPLTTGASADNVAREKLNGLIRGSYSGQLFDLAAVESTKPDGSKASGLYDGYASDSGHLNAAGSNAAASSFLEAVARASR
ncbi:hypothetical protein ACFQWH_20480 [Mycolicibacterium sp. GCM10028919]|uniref:hypothetical protein n=1 Tax=Mycolicibacterium sp. GCM10028919 TaxID=3273401 RepID=UPI003622C271